MNETLLASNWMSVSMAARQLGRSLSTIYRWASKGDRWEEDRSGRPRLVRLSNAPAIGEVPTASAAASPTEEEAPGSEIPAAATVEVANSHSPIQFAVVPDLQSSSEGQRCLQFRW